MRPHNLQKLHCLQMLWNHNAHIACCRFFPLFFKEKVGLSPGMTNAVMACIPLALAPLCFVSKRVSKYIGAQQPGRTLHCTSCTFQVRICKCRAKAAWLNLLVFRSGDCVARSTLGAPAGRVPTIMLFEAVGVASMTVMGLFPSLWPRCCVRTILPAQRYCLRLIVCKWQQSFHMSALHQKKS